jgi:hypothetical protein
VPESKYLQDLEHLAVRQDRFIDEFAEQPLSGEILARQGDGMRIYEARGPAPVIETFYHQILVPSFPPGELISIDEVQAIATGDAGSVWLAQDEDGTILGGAVAEWNESTRVLLLGYLAVRPGTRGGGTGGPLYVAALACWRERFNPCLVLAEVEDPAAYDGSEAYGDPGARLRFYLNRGSRILHLPYFQPALGPEGVRIPGLLLLVLHADPVFAGAGDNTIDAGVVREFLENYQSEYEGKVATDDQAMELWRALDRPGGVPCRDSW